jgi:hypothetical protein
LKERHGGRKHVTGISGGGLSERLMSIRDCRERRIRRNRDFFNNETSINCLENTLYDIFQEFIIFVCT